MKILITGGTGLVGTRLTELLLDADHQVAHLTRDPSRPATHVQAFGWEVPAGRLDPAAIRWADAIVNLAGAGVGDGRWTAARKREIHDSRVRGTQLLHQALLAGGHRVRVVVSASATGYYGDSGDRIVDEAAPPASDFLATVCRDWEAAATAIRSLPVRVPVLRLGIVLTERGGALPRMALPVRLGVGSPLGTGRQWVPWIHLDDACRALAQALTDERFTAAYNITAPAPVTNAELTRELARTLHRPLWAPRVPAWVLRIVVGEMSESVLASCRPSCERLLGTGFRFAYPRLTQALISCYQPAPAQKPG